MRRALLFAEGPLAEVLLTVLAYEGGSVPRAVSLDATRSAYLSALAWTSSVQRAVGE